MKMKFQIIIKTVAVAAVFTLAIGASTRLLTPKFVDNIPEGSLIEEYYKDNHKNDVIFIGDCEAYEVFVPNVLKHGFGLTAYVRGSAEQRIWQSYYIACDTFKYETPKYMVLSVEEMQYDEPCKEEYNRMTIDGMRLSPEKLACVRASMNPDENTTSYIFPILRYHDRWNKLTGEDFNYFFSKPAVSERGYLPELTEVPMTELPPVKPLADYSLPDKCTDYLNRIIKLCENHGTKLILVKSPVLYPHWYSEWSERISEIAKENNITYLDLTTDDKINEIGIDWETDTSDGGAHLNYYGAVKTTNYIGRIFE